MDPANLPGMANAACCNLGGRSLATAIRSGLKIAHRIDNASADLAISRLSTVTASPTTSRSCIGICAAITPPCAD